MSSGPDANWFRFLTITFCVNMYHGSVWGSPNGTIGNFTNGTIGSQWYHCLTNGTIGLPMVPIVPLGEPMVPLALPLVQMILPMVPLVKP